jgi:hypothetical protein
MKRSQAADASAILHHQFEALKREMSDPDEASVAF